MRNLFTSGQISSLSYGYTAGAAYRYSGTFGSLTLGGYDKSRCTGSNITFPFAGDDSRPLQIGVQQIVAELTLQGLQNVLPTPQFFEIDSTLPYIWLPQDSCDAFAAAFGLQYDNTTELYTVNNTIHETLVSQNPQLTFVLGTDPYSGATLALVLPYAAFDLQASYPIYPNATRYFPIRQAANEAQYTIGRTFLQEAYITVDYGRSNFTVCQATFSDPMPDEQLVAILPPGYNTSTSNSTAPHHSSSSIGSGAIAGIVVGAVVALTLLVAGFLYLRRRRNRSHPGPSENPDVDVAIHVDEEKAIVGEELDSSDVNELPPGMPPEVEGDAALWSTHGANAKAELDSGQRTWAEAEGSPGFVHELEGSDPLARRAAER